MGDAILSILLELCKLLTSVSICPCDMQTYFPGKIILEQGKGGDRAKQNVRVAWWVEMGVWELATGVFGGSPAGELMCGMRSAQEQSRGQAQGPA